MTRLGRTLAGRILIAVLAIVAVTTAIGLVLFLKLLSREHEAAAVDRATSIATSLGNVPAVADAVTSGDPNTILPSLGERVRAQTGASYVVIIDAHGVRHSHPIPSLIGKRIEESVVALDGQVHTLVDHGALGTSANSRAPIFDAAGRPVGEVSVGILETEIGRSFTHLLAEIAAYAAVALALGVVASLLLARAIKRVTFGLEPTEIVALLHEREATLHGIHEGVLAIDDFGLIKVVNDEARRLLDIPNAQAGDIVTDLIAPGRLRDIVVGTDLGPDRLAVTDDHLLVFNRMPVVVNGRSIGWVVTIRDHTEMEALVRQLDSVEGLTTALRAQEHEFSNRLHVLSVLLELGETEEARTYSQQLQSETMRSGEEVRAHIESPTVAALLLAKMTVAAERGVRVTLDPASLMQRSSVPDLPILTVLGNLIDNAVDSVADDPRTAGASVRGEVVVHLVDDGEAVQISVRDSGPGIAADRLDDIFVDGYSTKEPRAGLHRGVGLALVHRLVSRLGGHIEVTSPGGAEFVVTIPVRLPETVG